MVGSSARKFVAVSNGLRGGLDSAEGEVLPSDHPWGVWHELSSGQHPVPDEPAHDGVTDLEDVSDLFQGQSVRARIAGGDLMVVAHAGDPR